MTDPETPLPPAPRRRLSPEARRDELLNAAERLFVERGFAAVTMSDIAAAAGVTRPLANYHFGSKERVYIECVRRARTAYDDALLHRIDLTAVPREQLAAGADAFFAILEDDRDRWMLLFGSNAVLAGPADEDLAALRFGTIAAIEAMLRAAAPHVDAQRITATAHAASGIGERLGHWWLSEPSLTRQSLVEHFTDILWLGLAVHL